MVRGLLCLFFLFSGIQIFAQADKSPNSSEIYQKIKKLKVLGSVLYIAAHPDDENTRLLAWLSNDRLYRTGYLSITRGDGGQNLIGEELGVPLGLIRTQELLAARRIDGAEQFFTRAFDFGFSKNPEETFDIWGKEKILSDVVWVIRRFQPDVIITRFPTTGEGGHGHHTASAILAVEAFSAAADSSRFPEQFAFGVRPWQAKRLLWNTFNFGSVNTTSKDQFQLDAGGYNSLLGKSYGEIAAMSRSEHKSQGFGVALSRGRSMEYFKTISGEAPHQSIMDGIETNWSRTGMPALNEGVNALLQQYSFQNPERSLTQLIRIYKDLKKAPEGYWRNQKLKEVQELIHDCAGLFIEVSTNKHFAVVGDSIKTNFTINKRAGGNIQMRSVKIFNRFFVLGQVLPLNQNISYQLPLLLPATTPISQPYWLQNEMLNGSFVVDDQLQIGKPWNDAFTAEVTVNVNGEDFVFQVPLVYKSTDPVKGEQIQPLMVVPRFEVKPVPQIALSINQKPASVSVFTEVNADSAVTESIQTYVTPSIREKKEGELYEFFPVEENARPGKVKFVLNAEGGKYEQYRNTIRYDHIPEIIYFSPSVFQLVPVNLQVAGKRVGYIAGAGDKIPDALKNMGYDVVLLKEDDINENNLKDLNAVVAGVRAYNVHNWLSGKHDVLMKYVHDGGVYLVQYNTNSNVGPLRSQIGPVPFDISRSRVTDENADVIFTNAGSPLLNYPNKITASDFESWIQERSIYHASNFGNEYQTLFLMNDPGEAADEGSLIYRDYGKGRFIYTGIVFFRELPAGVAGAYRLFANLLAPPQQ